MRVEHKDINKLLKQFGAFEKDIPYIVRTTTNNIAFEALQKIKAEVRGKLNISKQKIPNSWRVRKATNQRPYAELYVDEWSWQHKVLAHHYSGGDRARKGLEKALIYLGYMDKSDILTPPPGVKLRPSIYNKIIAQLKLTYKSGYSANETKRSRARKKDKLRFFLVPKHSKKNMHPGIYARMDGVDKPICILRIARKPNYKKRLDAVTIAKKVISRRFESHLYKAVQHAWQTRMRF